MLCHHLLVYRHQCVTSLDLQPCAYFFYCQSCQQLLMQIVNRCVAKFSFTDEVGVLFCSVHTQTHKPL